MIQRHLIVGPDASLFRNNSFLLAVVVGDFVKLLAVCLLISVSLAGLFFQIPLEDGIRTYLDKSVPYIGTDIPRMGGIDGSGIKIAVIDTGVDFEHPDLSGWGSDGKVVGGYNFVQEGMPPTDTNGHGTQVAGIIAADGQMTGVAPKAKILAYKVSEDGEGVSPELIIRAIKMAVDDGADIINISLGINKTNAKIEKAVNYALENGIVVVVAAGNDGPNLETIGSPGRNFGAVTVGATYNNLTSSLVGTLDIDEKPYTVIPMMGSTKIDDSITGRMVFGGYGRTEELKDLDVRDAILIVERGSNVSEEMLYFSTKESNAADAGAAAMIVYNNEPGIFLGELIHEFVEPRYEPRIPVVSMDREDGLEVVKSAKNGSDATIDLFYNPDFVAHFSSRGPVSPFYIKPGIVAPGAYINSTQNEGKYNFTSGTSYAAPHVSGAAALLLQKNPELDHREIKSLLLTTAIQVSDVYGREFLVHELGSGRLDVGNAYGAKLIIMPPNFVAIASSDSPRIQKQLELVSIEGTLDGLDVSFEGPEFVRFKHAINGDVLQITADITGNDFGEHEGKVLITHNGTSYVVPFLLHYTMGSIYTAQNGQSLSFEVSHPEGWDFAKISVTNSRDGKTDIVTATPARSATVKIYENSEYWISAKIKSGGNTSDAFEIFRTDTVPEDWHRLGILDIPERQILIVVVIMVAVAAVGLIRGWDWDLRSQSQVRRSQTL